MAGFAQKFSYTDRSPNHKPIGRCVGLRMGNNDKFLTPFSGTAACGLGILPVHLDNIEYIHLFIEFQ